MLKKLFVITAILFSILSSGFLFAENDDDVETDDGSSIDLLQIREVILKSYSLKSTASFSVPVYLEATLLNDEIVLGVENYQGFVSVDVVSLSGSGSVNDAFYVNGAGVQYVDVSQLTPGDYSIELNLGQSTYVGKFSINE